jgi:serine protease AprX
LNTTSIRHRTAGTIIALLLAAALLITVPGSSSAASASSQWLSAGWESSVGLDYKPKQYEGSMYTVTRTLTGADEYWEAGYTGFGIDVALIDTGVAPVNGLTFPGKVVNGPDLSFESQADNLRYLDTYGHGTHIAGIIAGRDDGVWSAASAGENDFVGMAPSARLISLKVADANGTVDISQVIAAIDWVVQHHDDPGLNIRVLNMSFGTDSLQSYEIDPLAYAVERAWDAGIVVVVAAGNDGNASPLRNPAADPFVIAVGAADAGVPTTNTDDSVTTFTSCGTNQRHVDLIAPGKSIVSLRNPGSAADLEHPDAAVADRFFLGSGTSQAAAIVSGAAALVLSQRPQTTPDQVKALLMDTARPLGTNATQNCQGAGHLDLAVALDTKTPRKSQNAAPSVGTGSLEGARGSFHVELNGVALGGEQDIMGEEWQPWCTLKGKKYHCDDTRWVDGTWNGTEWTGTDWTWSALGLSWSGLSWSGLTWSGLSWSGLTWSANEWNGLSWSGLTWSGLTWSGLTWSTDFWTGLSWKFTAL